MCGLVGYLGQNKAAGAMLRSLQRLEYRGYDSAGMATVSSGSIHVCKCAGKLDVLKRQLNNYPLPGTIGLGHTRWATHGSPSERNSHPHLSTDRTIAIAHNGVIDNFLALKKQLGKGGITFSSDTDSEIIVHLIARNFTDGRDFFGAVSCAFRLLKGKGSFIAISSRQPGTLIGARFGSPLILAVGKNENCLASEESALLIKTEKVVELQNNQICVVKPTSFYVVNQSV